MELYDYTNIKKLYTVGDIHGDFAYFFNTIKRSLSYNDNDYKDDVHPLIQQEKEKIEQEIEEQNRIIGDRPRLIGLNDGYGLDTFRPKKIMDKCNNLFNDSVIIVCGDCGFGFSKYQYYIDKLTKINDLFNKTNTHIIFVRGNHDDPSYFNENLINFSNIKTVKDYSVIKTEHHNTLCVGGAISVDRIWRKQQEIRLNKYSKSKKHKLYWDGEECYIDENILSDLKDNNIKIDSVVTHTCPSFCFPKEKDTALGWLRFDESLKDELDNERNIMTDLFNMLKTEHDIKFWSYGHFHQQYEYLEQNVAFIALDDNISIKNPMNVREHLIAMEEERKKKRKKRTKIEFPNSDSLKICSDDNNEMMFDRETLERLHEEIHNLAFQRPNENVENNNEGLVMDLEVLDEAPF